ncbi:DUF223 domain protein [Medicago truncatula]|uniref:DUF223 domain protein n=1 Tax=Medicago truncatula TaxID=3880 RepID=G7K930_MEDTR|nr:DUF223 domain protein [Medicago truncatula]
MKISTKHDFISDVSPRKQSWTLVVRVVRAWFGQDYKNKKLPFSMEFVLMDQKGDQIGASIRRTLIYKFKKQLQEGMVFTISSFDVASKQWFVSTITQRIQTEFHKSQTI